MDTELLRAGRLLGTALAIGLLIGLERERKGDSRGLRTFSLVALLGGIVAMLAQQLAMPLLVPVGLAAVAALAVAAYWHDHARASEPPTTSMIAMAVTGTLGLLCGTDRVELAVPLAIVVASLLYFKVELQGLAGRIGREDLTPVLQFGALTFIVLPLLPDRPYGPHGSLNPHEIWLMVVLVAGVGLAGYLALRLAGQRYGAPLAAIMGGLVSSTATTLVFARHTRAGGGDALNALLIFAANLTMLARLAVIGAIVQPPLLAPLAGVLGAGGVALLAFGAWLAPRARRDRESPLPDVRNPTDLRVALGFGLAFGVISLIAAWASARLGPAALYAVAAVSGLTDVDAITLSGLRLFGAGDIDAASAVTVVAIAVVANLAFKAAIAYGAGTRALGRLCAAGFAIVGAAVLGAARTLH
jgi:uncharacterized membrane protein (DUF4010 family)